MAKDAAQQARDQAKAEGKGFLGQWGDQLKSGFHFSQRYLTMTPNAALAETPGNFALENSGIREVKLHLKEDHRGGGNAQYDREFSVEFKSTQGEYEFRMAEISQFTELLKQVYGDRVKMPFGYFSKTLGSKGPVNVGFRIGR